MIQFLPKNLDLKELLTNNPPDFKYHIDHFIHLCSLLYELPAKKKDSMREGGYVPLHAHLLKKVNNNYKKYFNYLIKHGVIECDNSYIVGEKSKGYRFSQKYLDIIRPVYIHKYTLTKNLKEERRFNRNMYAKYDYLYKWFDDRLAIDFNGAEQKLTELYFAQKNSSEENPIRKFNVNMINVYRLHVKDFYFTVDSTSHRLHTLLTKIKKELRSYITYNNNPLANIDIQCSQPTLSLCLLDPSFYNTELKQERVSINIDPKLKETLPIQTIAEYVNKNQEKFNYYRELVMNDFYVSMAKILNPGTEVTKEERKKIKGMMFMVLYSSNKFLGGNEGLPKRVFKQMFPEVYEVFKMYKSKGHEKLPVLLQKIESKLILDLAGKQIARSKPDMALYTIHDSIVVPAPYTKYCKDILTAEAIKYLGFAPILNEEHWVPVREEALPTLQS